MRYFRYAFYAALAVVLITVALANRQIVTLRLFTEEIASLFGFQADIQLPLFLVIFIGIVAGLLIGFVWEWMREHKHRAEGAQFKREKVKLEREVSELRDNSAQTQDDVLALLEDGGTTR